MIKFAQEAVRAVVVVLVALATLVGCTSDPGPDLDLAREWLPKLQEENAFVCQRDDCGDEVTARRLALTAELQSDAEQAGPEFDGVASLAGRVHDGIAHWEADCYPSGTWSAGAAMSCDQAFDYVLRGTDQLQEAVERAALG